MFQCPSLKHLIASELVNIRFQVVGNRVIAITTRNIAEGEELIADYSDFRTRYNKYLEVFERIHRHNSEVLDEQENTLSTLKWFMNGLTFHHEANILMQLQKDFQSSERSTRSTFPKHADFHVRTE